MKKTFFTLIVLSLITAVSCQQKTNDETQIKQLTEKNLEVWNGGDLSILDEILSPDCVRHGVDIGDDIKGIEAYKNEITTTRTSFPDMKVVPIEIMISGDKVITRYTVEGTNTGPSEDLPPTGKSFKFPGITVAHVVDGKLVEEWIYYNAMIPYSQLGFTLSPPELPSE